MKIIILFILCIFLMSFLYFYEGYSYIKQESPIPEKSPDDNSDCQAYFDFISKPINEIYYTSPRFLNPQESCKDECIEGVWFDDHHNGAVKCCDIACKRIKP